MSVAITFASQITAIETLETNVGAASDKNVTHDAYDESASLSSSTTPPVTKCAFFLHTMAGATDTIDLTALTGTNGAVVNGTDLKVQCLRVKNLGANALTIGEGAVNGYELLGNAWTAILLQNQHVTFYLADAAPDIAAAAKNIDLAGTDTQTSEWTVIMG